MATFIQGSGTIDTTNNSYKIPILHANNCGLINMGDLNWSYNTTWSSYGTFYVLISDKKYGINNMYQTSFANGTSYNMLNDNEIAGSNGNNRIYVRCDTYTDATAFKSAMSGKYLYYQRSTDSSFTQPTITNIYLDKPLYKLGDYTDLLDSESGKLKCNVGIKVLDGTESWMGTDYFYYTQSDMIASLYGLYYCNQFSTRVGSGDTTHDIQFGSNNSIIYFFEKTSFPSGVTDVATWKSWLATQYANGTPCVIYYPLATETETTVSLPTITNVLGKNMIEITTDISPSHIDAVYRKQTK